MGLCASYCNGDTCPKSGLVLVWSHGDLLCQVIITSEEDLAGKQGVWWRGHCLEVLGVSNPWQVVTLVSSHASAPNMLGWLWYEQQSWLRTMVKVIKGQSLRVEIYIFIYYGSKVQARINIDEMRMQSQLIAAYIFVWSNIWGRWEVEILVSGSALSGSSTQRTKSHTNLDEFKFNIWW